MIERYTRGGMAALWSYENQLATWLEVELLICEGLAATGHIPAEAGARIREKARFEPARVLEIEEKVRHDVAAFVEAVGESLGEDARYFHWGVTSSDVVDTALAVRTRRAGLMLLEAHDRLLDVLARRAREHRRTVVVGRTHGMHAEPTSLGLKFLSWYAEGRRNRDRLESAVDEISAGKISGAVGNFAHIGPEVETYVCGRLGLHAEPVSTQVVTRDRHAAFLATLAVMGGSLERIAVEVRHWQRTELGEANEAFGADQKGSSSMPHKRNPVVSERIAGLSRVLRGYAVAGFEDMALWHERDISHSSVERVIVPDATTLLDFMMADAIAVLEGLDVHPDRMQDNLERTGGLAYSQRILMELLKKGLVREKAYRMVQAVARESYDTGRPFREVASASAALREHFSPEHIQAFFDPGYYLARVDEIYARAGLE